jgi:hypothetical protein
MIATTPGLGEVLFDGDGRRPYGLGFRLGEELGEERIN